MGRILKFFVFLVILVLVVIVVYAVFFELPAPERDITIPVPTSNE